MHIRSWAAVAAVVLLAAAPAWSQQDPDLRLRGAAYNNKPEVLDEALKAGADVNSTDQNGYTALMWAAENNRPDMVATLLAHGADPNLKSATGLTAARLGRDYPKVLALLKGAGAVIPPGYVVAGEPLAQKPAPAGPVQIAPKPVIPAPAAPKPAAGQSKVASADTKAYCKKMYARAYSLCGASSRDCKIIAASNWETCEATGRWP